MSSSANSYIYGLDSSLRLLVLLFYILRDTFQAQL